jgi:hypothetical protein
MLEPIAGLGLTCRHAVAQVAHCGLVSRAMCGQVRCPDASQVNNVKIGDINVNQAVYRSSVAGACPRDN